MSSNEVVRAGSTIVELYSEALFPELRHQDPRESEARFLKRFEKAKTIDDLFDVLEGNNASALVGHVIQVDRVEWSGYQSDDGLIPLAVVTGADTGTGEVIEFATTSKACTHFIRRAELIGALPFRATIEQVITRSGQKALNLSRPHQLPASTRRTFAAEVIDEGEVEG